jgi:hypothetical protein
MLKASSMSWSRLAVVLTFVLVAGHSLILRAQAQCERKCKDTECHQNAAQQLCWVYITDRTCFYCGPNGGIMGLVPNGWCYPTTYNVPCDPVAPAAAIDYRYCTFATCTPLCAVPNVEYTEANAGQAVGPTLSHQKFVCTINPQGGGTLP